MLVTVIVVLSISLTLFGIWARAVLRERTRLASQQFQLQAARLAEAGVHRADSPTMRPIRNTKARPGRYLPTS